MSAGTIPLLQQGTVCACCARQLAGDANTAVLGDLSFHAACVPRCELCGGSLAASIAADWSYQVLVVSSPYGYEQVPYEYRCAACRESTLLGEPSAQD